jgi:hypothetical protein
MSNLYTSLHVSPRKKRCPPERDDDMTIDDSQEAQNHVSNPSHDHRSLTYVVYLELQVNALPGPVQSHAPPNCHLTCRGFAPFIGDFSMLSLIH